MVKYLQYFLSTVLLLLSTPGLSQIQLNLEESLLSDDIPPIQIEGSLNTAVGDTLVPLFGLDEQNLKNAVEQYFGKRPDDVFFKSPTPWGDLYKRYQCSKESPSPFSCCFPANQISFIISFSVMVCCCFVFKKGY